MPSNPELIQGFSKMKSHEKLEKVASFFNDQQEIVSFLKGFHHQDQTTQDLLIEFSENTISNFPMPYCIAPNFIIDGKTYAVPMVIEESSVVAAASHSAKFWAKNGGFKTTIVNTEKVGQVHFIWNDDVALLKKKFEELKTILISETSSITENMRKRGGGILDIQLKNLQDKEPGLMQLFCTFETKDSMGANFINSCLEQFATSFQNWYSSQSDFSGDGLQIVMCILSNLTPNCRVKCWVETPIENFDNFVPGFTGEEFVNKFRLGVKIAEVDPYRAVTHNKGIYNGIDAVVLASGNDFRAVEACGHTYASTLNGGVYSPLTKVEIKDGIFKFELDVAMSLGVVGGLTNLHPLVKFSMELLNHPSAQELMGIAAAAGLANNFSAVKSLVTSGIQEGHMKMHLFNIMNQLEIPQSYRDDIVEYFKHHKVSVSEVRKIYNELKQN